MSYSLEAAQPDAMRAILEALPEVLNWRRELPFNYFLISEKDANTLTDLIRAKTGNRGAFLIVELGSNKQGYISKEGWRFLNEKHLPGE